ncbi:cellulose biosynthesis protein BcsN [Pararhizobium antarcticum]|uniref:Cellulose biosynthesis protein BcsN n=1 Tax=Pararhizobium antarcticum TaxID=1798805 RepID=A0A657LWE8_9HYPH|nr:cellulose biosynthesis protein BcsN [Pararhizobium antarcticum]OJF97283.1 hypothetical protein AX761_15370 [Rhizobium sp. 58]OJF99045.1 hypothetical protein AX760_13770 [Pararhizobium antarcticum]
MIRRLFWLVPLVLSGCNTIDDPFLQTASLTRDGAGAGPALARSVSPDLALGTIPVISGSAASVRQTVRKNYALQTIVYGNTTDLPGENTLVVTVGAPGSEKGFTRAPSAGDLRGEIATALPGVAMKISTIIGDNAYGTFGYASGATGKNGSCIYAWQLARNVSARDGAGFSALGRSKYAAQVRLRYCATATSVEQLVGLMNALRLKPVTDQTLETLRYSAGQGVASVPVLQPVVQQAAIETQPVPQRQRIRRIASPEVVEDDKETVAPDDGSIKNPVKVPLPSAAAVSAGSAGKEPAAEVAVAQPAPVAETVEADPVEMPIAKPTLIPLPSAVAIKK